jgi:tetratricopeptide (TPR) repeat protein
VATAADLADVLSWQLDIDVPQSLIRATELRMAGNVLAMNGDFAEALAKYQEALNLGPKRGRHLLHSNMSAAHLQAGDKDAALQHAQLAVQHAPVGFHMAFIRLIDSYYALGRFSEAAEAVSRAVKSDPGFKALPEYKVIRTALKKAGAAVAV